MKRGRNIGFFAGDFAVRQGRKQSIFFRKKTLHFPARRVEIGQAGYCSTPCRLDAQSVPHDQVCFL